MDLLKSFKPIDLAIFERPGIGFWSIRTIVLSSFITGSIFNVDGGQLRS